MRKRDFPASYPLLGLLTWGPANGYQLRQRAQASLAHFWSEGFGQIYPSLEVFLSRGLAEVVSEEKAAQKSRTLAITSQGRALFQEWLEKPVESYSPHRHELLVKVFFAAHLSPEILRTHLERYRRLQEGQTKRLRDLSEALAAQEPGNPSLPFWTATINHGLALSTALEQWCLQTEPEVF